MQIGSSYSGAEAFDMVSKSAAKLNELNQKITDADMQMDKKMLNVSVESRVSHPVHPEDVHQVDTSA